MSRLSFHEKLLWAQLAAIAAVVVFYGRFLVHSHPGGHYTHAIVLGILILAVFIRFLVRRSSGSVMEDERDRAVAALGDRWSNITLWTGLVIILVAYWDHGDMRSASALINTLFHLLLLAAVVRIVRELVAYRGAA